MDKHEKLIRFIRSEFNEKSKFIPLHEPRFLGNEKKYVMDAIDSTFVSSVGAYVDRFEEIICKVTGSKYAIATSNGTSALHIALLLADVQKDDEVITQGLSFIATANAISYCGASPIFLDVDKTTLGLSPKSVKDFLTTHTKQNNGVCVNKTTGKKIKALVPMHTFGHPVAIDELLKICFEHNIKLVEDAAESLGSYYKGQHTGTFGQSGAFSFNGNKTLTSGGGGVIITNDEHLAKRAKHLSTTAKLPHQWEYTHDEIGYNYRMPNLNAALACAQLEQLSSFIENKRELAKKYIQFGKENSISFINEPNNSTSNFWLNAICLKNREERDLILKKLNEAGIMSRQIWTLLYKMPMFSSFFKDKQTNAQWLEDRIINVPSSVRT